jgi:hypothetical protein
VQHDPDAQEQGRLQQGVAGHVHGRSGQPERGEQRDAGQEHSRVADRGEGQQPLDVTLAETEQRAHDGGEQPEGQERGGDDGPVPERLAEHRPVHPRDAVEPEFHHDAGEQHADRGRGHRVGVGEPEVERHDRALDQQAGDDQHERHHHEAVRPVPRDVLADLGHVQRAGAAVDQRDTGQRQVGAHAVGDREVQCALERTAFLRPVGGQCVGRDAHQLKPHEQVEDVPGEAEPGHAGQKRQHQRVVIRPHLVEVPPGEEHGGGDQQPGQGGQSGIQRPCGEVDADRDPV